MTFASPYGKGSMLSELLDADSEYGFPISEKSEREKKYDIFRHSTIAITALGAVAANYWAWWQADWRYGMKLAPWKHGELTFDHLLFTAAMGSLACAPLAAYCGGLIANGISTSLCKGLEKVVTLFKKGERKTKNQIKTSPTSTSP